MDSCEKKSLEVRKRILLTTGTVALPGPFPELGEIILEENAFDFSCGPKDVLCIRTCPDPYSVTERRILLRDVVALFVPHVMQESPTDLDNGSLTPGEDAGKLIKRLQEQGPVRAIVYVREDTPVAMTTLSGMTASDSQAYRCAGPGCD